MYLLSFLFLISFLVCLFFAFLPHEISRWLHLLMRILDHDRLMCRWSTAKCLILAEVPVRFFFFFLSLCRMLRLWNLSSFHPLLLVICYKTLFATVCSSTRHMVCSCTFHHTKSIPYQYFCWLPLNRISLHYPSRLVLLITFYHSCSACVWDREMHTLSRLMCTRNKVLILIR